VKSNRGAEIRDLLARAAIGAAAGVAARLLAELSRSGAALLGLDLYGAGAFLAGVVFGWAGVVGFWAGDALLYVLIHASSARVELLLPAFLLGVGGFLAFRQTPRVDRRIPGLKSYLTLFGGAIAASLPASILVVHEYFPAFSWSAVFVWQAATVASVVLLAPPVLLLCPRRLWKLREPIARENGRRSAAARSSGAGFGSDSSAEVALQRPARKIVDVALVIASVASIHLTVLAAGPGGAFNHWLFLLYSVPLLFAVTRGGFKGGLLAGAAVGLSLLLPAGNWTDAREAHLSTVERQGGLLLFSLFGALAGATHDRERNLTRQLERSNRTLRRDLERVLAALRSAMEAKDQYTEGHLRRVSRFALEVGRRLKLQPGELELLEVASLLHDVGKIGIADSVLRKPGPLDPRERELMQRHPSIGARILENVDGLKEAADMVRHHQERFDGVTSGDFPGYPDGLAGRAIPLGARIIAVVDAFDAMTSDRPYRDSVGFERARRVLQEESGRQFDPRVVETFLALLQESDWDEAETSTSTEAVG
jgi:HD-GYP domain-containing protein (c-di-GMP phosphodiesterase class II)